jgi:hypothetical protein
MQANAERLYSLRTIRHSLVTKMDFIGFILPKFLKSIHAGWPVLSNRLTAASLPGCMAGDPAVERASLAKPVCGKVADMRPAPTDPIDDPLCVR